MIERELCPLCGVPLEDEAGPVLEGDCPVHGVIGRLRGVDDFAPPGLLGQEAEDGLSVWPGAFEDTLPVGTAGWRRVDMFEVAEGGPEAHDFEIVDELDSFRSSQKLRYPDGTTVEAHGMAHEGGRARWTLEGMQPGHDALIVVQTDVMYAGGDLKLEAGPGAVVFPDFPPDRRYRARNRVVPIPGAWVEGDTLAVSLGRVESTKDLSHFAVWVYQSRTPDPDLYADEHDDSEPSMAEAPAAQPDVEGPGELADQYTDPITDAPAAFEADESIVDESIVGEASMDAPLLGAPPSLDGSAADPMLADASVDGVDDDRLETIDVPAASLLDAPDQTPAPLGADDEDPSDPDDTPSSADVRVEESVADEPDLPQPESADQTDDRPEPAGPDAEPEPPEVAPLEAAAPVEPSPAVDSEPPPPVAAPAEPSAAALVGASQPPAADAPTARAAEQKLVTITLADADHAHGTGHAHLASELRAGWRIAKLECLPGPRGGWLVVLLER